MQDIVRDKQHRLRQLYALTRYELRSLVKAIAKYSPTLHSERDTAIILVGYAGLLMYFHCSSDRNRQNASD